MSKLKGCPKGQPFEVQKIFFQLFIVMFVKSITSTTKYYQKTPDFSGGFGVVRGTWTGGKIVSYGLVEGLIRKK